MNYQMKMVKRILEQNKNSVYRVNTKYWFADDVVKVYDIWEPEELEAALKGIEERTQDMELVVTTDCNWFDEGGHAQALIFANKKATKRVWEAIDTRKGYLMQLEFMKDLDRFPEDYVVYQNSAI